VLFAVVLAMMVGAGCRQQTPQAGVSVQPQSSPGQEQGVKWFEVSLSSTEQALEGATRVVVVNPNGGVQVVPVAAAEGKQSVKTAVRVSAQGKDEAEAREAARGVEVHTTRTEDDVRIEVKLPQGVDEVRADLTVVASAELGMRVEVQSGDVQVRDWNGPVSVSGMSGNVSLERVMGEVAVDVESGNVELVDARSGIDVHAGSGSARLRQVGGEVVCRTMSGNLDLEYTSGPRLVATTQSGSIRLRVLKAFSGEMEVRTQSGNVRMDLPRWSNCRVKTMTGSGEITSDLPLTEVTRSGPNIEGVLGRGEGRVLVTTGSGNIELLGR